MSQYLIVVAGGKGLRMGGSIPKQFLPINGLPVLMRTLQRFRDYSEALKIILVLPKDQQEYWKSLCAEHRFDVHHEVADGGITRFQSVKNGLRLIPEDAKGIVGVHDGVRPFVSLSVIKRCYDTAKEAKAVVPVVPVVETLRQIGGSTVARDDFRLVQTPQTFDISLLKQAYNQEFRDDYTDDASVVEAMGQPITLVEGNRENIKITTPFDILIAETLCRLPTESSLPGTSSSVPFHSFLPK